MAKKQRSGNVWYAVKNALLALVVFVFALMSGSGSIAGVADDLKFLPLLYLMLWGILCQIRAGDSLGETSMSATCVLMGFGLALEIGAGALFTTSLAEQKWFVILTSSLSCLLVIYIGFKQRKKLREPFCSGTSYAKLHTILANLITWGIIATGVFFIVQIMLNIPSNPSKAVSALHKLFSALGVATMFMAVASWIYYIVIVEKALKETGRTINSYKSGSSKRRRSSGAAATSTSSASGADVDKVRREMESLANYLTGGFDEPWKNCRITYSVSVTVSRGNIDFMLKCSLSGQYDPQYESTVMSYVSQKIQKRQQLVMDKATDRLKSINPAGDYNISVDVRTA